MKTDDATIVQKRLAELADRSWRNSICCFSDFVTAADRAAFIGAGLDRSPCGVRFFGGYSEAERVMIGFGTESVLGWEEPFPVANILISPRAPKFAEDLAHRDFLGALMNLGIERDRMGDLILARKAAAGEASEEGQKMSGEIVPAHSALVFAEADLSDFICTSLTRVRHTDVDCSVITDVPAVFVPEVLPEDFVISSVRLDALVARVFGLSRGRAAALFSEGRVFVDGRAENRTDFEPAPEAVISVRGSGKFRYTGVLGETKKDRVRVAVEKFV